MDNQKVTAEQVSEAGAEEPRNSIVSEPRSRLIAYYAYPWTQIILISFICFCCPGMYNALSGLGGSGQVNLTVAANGNVALLSCTAATSLFFAGPLFNLIGPKFTFLLGGWTYALYSGSLLNFNHTANGAFVIGSAAILGIGASLLWVVQGAIMTTYVPEAQKGRAIAVFWIIFNFGGGIGSLAAFGLNYHSTTDTVSDATYIALMIIMLVGWILGVFICSPRRIRLAQLSEAEEKEEHSLKYIIVAAFKTMAKWRVACMLPLFFSANVFYSYQQNYVNGLTFDIRTRSLNGAFYWMAQMIGGLVIGIILDLPFLSRPIRARVGWAFLMITGVTIWGGGYAFQKWEDRRVAAGLVQDIDYTHGSISTGPIFLYIFYGAYDAFWQGFSYWLIGTESNSAERAAILVASYKTFQATGAAMAWRITALQKPAMTQLGMDWGLCIGALVICLPTVWTVSKTSIPESEASVGTDQRDAKKVDA